MQLQFAIPPTTLNEDDFISSFANIYEHSSWVAETIWAQGISDDDTDIDHFAGRMRRLVDAAGQDRQMALLRAHPELAGRLAVAGGLTEMSTCEQASAGLDQCTPHEFERFQALNSDYGSKFGHPFIIAVRGLKRADILAAFERRVTNDKAAEFAAALAEVHKIAELRLSQLAR